MAPQTWMLAASISALVKPRKGKSSKVGSSSFSAGTFRASVRKSAPSAHLLKANLMSKALASDASSPSSFSAVKPLARRLVWLIAGRLLQAGVADGVDLDLGDLASR